MRYRSAPLGGATRQAGGGPRRVTARGRVSWAGARPFSVLLTRRLHLSKGQLVDLEGRLQTRQWDDDAGLRHWKTEVVTSSLEMLSGRGKKEYAKEVQTAVADEAQAPAAAGTVDGQAAEIAIAM